MDDAGRRKTEKVWVSPPIIKDTYITMEAVPLAENRTRAALYATFRPRNAVMAPLTPAFVFMLKRDIKKDMQGLREFCETGEVGGREDREAEARV
jgi:hypothetical protein